MKERGQALVETILVFTFLLLLVIGIVEGGVLLQRQIIVVNAAREGARFGAFGPSPHAVYNLTLQRLTTAGFVEDDVYIAVVFAETNRSGNGFRRWEVYPDGATTPHFTKGRILEKLQGDLPPNDRKTWVGNLEIVIVDVECRPRSLLNLPLLGALTGQIPIGSWTVMRVHY